MTNMLVSQDPTLERLEKYCMDALMKAWKGQNDSAHDLAHVKRVRVNALSIMAQEGGDARVVLPAIWLHDIVNLPKDDPRRAQASKLAAEEAVRLLKAYCTTQIASNEVDDKQMASVSLGEDGSCEEMKKEKETEKEKGKGKVGGKKGEDFDALLSPEQIQAIYHAVHAHSFSANITPETLEAKIVQDADRLDALGAVGTARCFAVSGILGRPLLHEDDPLCKNRTPDDTKYAVDHFFVKLFKLPNMMQTKKGHEIATNRVQFMQSFLAQLEKEQCVSFS